MVFHIFFNLIRKLKSQWQLVTMGYRGDSGDALVCNTGGFMARLLKECPFLGKTTYIDKLPIIKKDNIWLLFLLSFPCLDRLSICVVINKS